MRRYSALVLPGAAVLLLALRLWRHWEACVQLGSAGVFLTALSMIVAHTLMLRRRLPGEAWIDWFNRLPGLSDSPRDPTREPYVVLQCGHWGPIDIRKAGVPQVGELVGCPHHGRRWWNRAQLWTVMEVGQRRCLDTDVDSGRGVCDLVIVPSSLQAAVRL